MTLHTPVLIGPESGDPTIFVTQQEYRNFIKSLLTVPTGVAAEGVIGSNGFQVTQNGSGDFTVNVGQGYAHVKDDDISNGGIYHVWNDAAFSVTVPAAPPSGSRTHRLVLQLRNKGESGSWTTYDFVPMLLADTGGGTPAQPNSAITLATIHVTSSTSSVLNSNITDWRQRADGLFVSKGSLTQSITTILVQDPDLLLANLAPSAQYEVTGLLIYEAHGSGAEPGFSWTWDTTGVSNFSYLPTFITTGSSNSLGTSSSGISLGSDTLTADSAGGGPWGVSFKGIATTAALGASPPQLGLKWGQGSLNPSREVQLDANSYLRAVRVA